MSEDETNDKKEEMWEAMSSEYRYFKMIERLTQKVDEINQATQDKIEFIVSQQAHFVANQQKAEERASKIEDLIVRLGNFTIEQSKANEEKIASLSDDVERKISALVDAQLRTEENIRRTEESIRNLTAVVDRYFSEGRNGKS